MNEIGTLLLPPDVNPSDNQEARVLVHNLKDFLWAILKIKA